MGWLGQLFNKIGSMFNWIFVIVPWQQAIRVRMGKTITVLGPGIHFQVPFIDRVYVQNMRERVAATTSQALTTRDGVTITLAAALRFSIEDIKPMYTQLHQASETICQIVEGEFSKYIVGHDAKDCTPEQVLEYVKGRVDLARFGLKLTDLFLTDFVRVKTYRLIQGGLDRYTSAAIQTDIERRGKGASHVHDW